MPVRPAWLKVQAVRLEEQIEFENMIRNAKLHTVCENAKCPNLNECFIKKTATFLVMGDICTRSCKFCAIRKGKPMVIDSAEPFRLSEAVKSLALKYIVITSVTRDDLSDGGAKHIASCIKAINNVNEGVIVEVLIPDFKGSKEALLAVAKAGPVVINHNLETVMRLYPKVRVDADYYRSLDLLHLVKRYNKNILTKSGIMLGLGETKGEVFEAMNNLRAIDCDLLTIGQYLSPSSSHLPVLKYYTPEEFTEIQTKGMTFGFKNVVAAPLVRSSYKAREIFDALN